MLFRDNAIKQRCCLNDPVFRGRPWAAARADPNADGTTLRVDAFANNPQHETPLAVRPGSLWLVTLALAIAVVLVALLA
jgi:hypothetical protein